MASSDTENKDTAKQWHDALKPCVVVDIGAGKGTYSDLCRGAGEHWIAIEAWGAYVAEFNLRSKYDEIVVSDIRYTDLPAVHTRPDLVIIGDVLEHLRKDEAKAVIRKLRGWAKHVLISVPMRHRDQGARGDNWFETHVDHWHHKEMVAELGAGLVHSKKGRILGYYLVKGV